MYTWKRNPVAFAKGKEGEIFKCSSDEYENGKYCVMKLFKKTKSVRKFLNEADFQRRAAVVGVAPPVIDFYAAKKKGKKGNESYLITELCDLTILEYIKKQKNLTDNEFEQIHELYKKLDSVNILHNDANPNNLMVSSHPVKRFYLIDYGLAKNGNNNTTICYPLMARRLQQEIDKFTNNPKQPKS